MQLDTDVREALLDLAHRRAHELVVVGHVGELAAFSLVIAIGTVIVGSIFLRLAQRYGLQD